MTSKKMFLTISIVLLFISCGTQDLQSYSEAKENLIGSWKLKDQNRILIFLDTAPNPTFVDSPKSPSSVDQVTTGLWFLRGNQPDDSTYRLGLATETSAKVYWTKKVGKKKMVLQTSPWPGEDDLVFNKIKEEK